MAASMTTPLPRHGVIVPLVTPLLPDYRPDLPSMARLIDFVLDAGAVGVLVLGSSGECIAINADDRRQVAEFANDHVAGRAHLMVGVPTLGTADAFAEARDLVSLGADSLLVAAPTGMRLSDSELRKHFEHLAGADAPLVAYDVPSRVGIALDSELIAQLAQAQIIVALKDSTSDLVKARRNAAATHQLDGFLRYTGCEECIDAALLSGYQGAVPGLANVFPQFHVTLTHHVAQRDWPAASGVQAQILALLQLYSHPMPGASGLAQFFGSVKEALRQLGIIEHATVSSVFTPADDTLPGHVAEILRLAHQLESEPPA